MGYRASELLAYYSRVVSSPMKQCSQGSTSTTVAQRFDKKGTAAFTALTEVPRNGHEGQEMLVGGKGLVLPRSDNVERIIEIQPWERKLCVPLPVSSIQ